MIQVTDDIEAAPTPLLTEEPHRGIRSENGAMMCIALSALMYALQGVTLSYAKKASVPYTEIIFLRAFLQGTAIFIYLKVTKQPLLGEKGMKAWVALRGALGGIGFIFLFHTMSTLPIGDATTLLSLYPIVTVILARFFLGEETSFIVIMAIILSVTGSVLVARPDFLFGEQNEVVLNITDADNSTTPVPSTGFLDSRASGVISALSTSVLAGFVLVIIRYMKNISNAQQLWPWSVTTAVLSAIITYARDGSLPLVISPSWTQLGYVSATIFFGVGGHWLMTFGVRFSQPGPASLIRTTEIVHAYIFEIFILGEHPPGLTLLGVSLVVCAVTAVAVDKWRRQCNCSCNVLRKNQAIDSQIDTSPQDELELVACDAQQQKDDDLQELHSIAGTEEAVHLIEETEEVVDEHDNSEGSPCSLVS